MRPVTIVLMFVADAGRAVESDTGMPMAEMKMPVDARWSALVFSRAETADAHGAS